MCFFSIIFFFFYLKYSQVWVAYFNPHTGPEDQEFKVMEFLGQPGPNDAFSQSKNKKGSLNMSRTFRECGGGGEWQDRRMAFKIKWLLKKQNQRLPLTTWDRVPLSPRWDRFILLSSYLKEALSVEATHFYFTSWLRQRWKPKQVHEYRKVSQAMEGRETVQN